MKKLITLGMLVAAVAFAGAAFAESARHGSLEAIEQQKLSLGSSPVTQTARPGTLVAGPGAAVGESRGSEAGEKFDFGPER